MRSDRENLTEFALDSFEILKNRLKRIATQQEAKALFDKGHLEADLVLVLNLLDVFRGLERDAVPLTAGRIAEHVAWARHTFTRLGIVAELGQNGQPGRIAFMPLPPREPATLHA